MKKLTIALLICLLPSAVQALDLNIYAGKYFASKNMGVPGSTDPQFVQGLRVSEDFLWKYLTVYVGYDSTMDAQNKDGALGLTSSFSPNRIAYTVGGTVNIYKGWYIQAEHMCDHAVSHGGITRQYSMLGFGYKAHFEPFK
jgi:hypothetical protein